MGNNFDTNRPKKLKRFSIYKIKHVAECHIKPRKAAQLSPRIKPASWK